MTWKCNVQNFKEIDSELPEELTKSMRSRVPKPFRAGTVFIRQNLTSEDDPRAERIKIV